MTMLRKIVSLGALLAASTATSVALALDLVDLAAQSKPAVVRLVVSDSAGRKFSEGTGFFVSADGRLVTNVHVIKGGSAVKATLVDGREVSVLGVLAADEMKDIAILQADGSGFPTLPLGDSTSLRAGHAIAVIGNPRGLAGSLSQGIVSAIREDGVGDEAERKWNEQIRSWGIQIQAPVSPGSSGSPIMNSVGEVVGIVVGAFTEGQSLNFGVPVEVPKTLLAGLASGARPTPFAELASKTATRNLILSGALFTALIAAYFIWSWRGSRGEQKPPKSAQSRRLS